MAGAIEGLGVMVVGSAGGETTQAPAETATAFVIIAGDRVRTGHQSGRRSSGDSGHGGCLGAFLPALLVGRRTLKEGEGEKGCVRALEGRREVRTGPGVSVGTCAVWVGGSRGTVYGCRVSEAGCRVAVLVAGRVGRGVVEEVGAGLFSTTDSGLELTLALASSGCSTELLVETALGVVGEGLGRLAGDDGGGLKTSLFALEITLEGIEEETVMGDGEPRRERDPMRCFLVTPIDLGAERTSKRLFAFFAS